MITLMICIENSKSGFAFFIFIITGFIIYVGNISTINQINPFITALCAVGYLVCGAGWSLFKWFLFLKKHKIKFIEEKKKWIADFMEARQPNFYKQESDLTEANAQIAFKAYLKSMGDKSIYDLNRDKYVPNIRSNKIRLIEWIIWWPFSMLNFVLFDLFRRIFIRIYNALAGVYKYMVRLVYGELADDFEELL